jgi:hypothetical protein
MTAPSTTDLRRADLVAALEEIIDALDRRVPQIAHAGETGIARDALVLRQEAVGRLDELRRDRDRRDDDLVHAVMTDDGG